MDPSRLRPRRRRGRPPRHVERPAQDRRRPASGGGGRDGDRGRASSARRRSSPGSPSAGRRSRPRRSSCRSSPALLEALYFGFLAAAYRRGDLSLVYPLARGSAPLLAVAIGVVLLGERLGPIGYLGVGGAPGRAAHPPAAVAVPAGVGSRERGSGRVRAPDRGHDRVVFGGRPGRGPRHRAVDLRRPDLGELRGLPVGVRWSSIGGRPRAGRPPSRVTEIATVLGLAARGVGGLITLGGVPPDPRRLHASRR